MLHQQPTKIYQVVASPLYCCMSKETTMKLSELPDGIWKQISKEESNLECVVKKVVLETQHIKNGNLVVNNWEYNASR